MSRQQSTPTQPPGATEAAAELSARLEKLTSEVQAKEAATAEAIVHRFLWAWAKSRGISPEVGGVDIGNSERLDIIARRFASADLLRGGVS